MGLKEIRDRLCAAAAHSYDAKEPYWLTGEVSAYAGQEAEQRQESDVRVEIIREKLSSLNEITLNEAMNRSFGIKTAQRMTLQDQRRMSRCLILASWKKAGRYTSSTSRNRVRFVNHEQTEGTDQKPFEF